MSLCSCFWVAQRFTAAIDGLFQRPQLLGGSAFGWRSLWVAQLLGGAALGWRSGLPLRLTAYFSAGFSRWGTRRSR